MSGSPLQSETDSELEARVDAMMQAAPTTTPTSVITIKVGEPDTAPVVSKAAGSSASPVTGPPTLKASKKASKITVVGSSDDAVAPTPDDQPVERVVDLDAADSSEPAPADITIGRLNIDTPQSDAAIDDIVAQEADQVLAALDAGLAEDELVADPPARGGHPIFWFMILVIVVVAIIAAVVLTNPNLHLPFGA